MAKRTWLVPVGVATALAGCGGGGGGGGTGTVVPSPPAPAIPTPFSINGPFAPDSFSNGGGGSRYVSAATTGGPQITITDPDVISPSKLGDINFDGDETITVQFPGQSATTLPYSLQGTTPGDLVPFSQWTVSGPDSSTTLRIYRPAVGTPGQIATSRYATMARVDTSAFRTGGGGYQIIGVPTAAADMPVAFNAHYEGLAVGDNLGTAKAAIDVSMVGGAAQVSGLISDPRNSNAVPANWRLRFSGAVTGAGFYGPAVLSYDGITPQNGTVVGAFYGSGSSAAAEVGGVWAVPSATPYLSVGANGAFVGAK